MPTLTILVGLPASGKSTVVASIIGDPFIYSTDAAVEALSSAEGLTYTEGFAKHIKRATSLMNAGVREAINANKDVVWDQTNVTASKRKSIMQMFPDAYIVKCICFIPPKSDTEWVELRRRLSNRPGKYIPSHVIDSMAKTFVVPTWDEGYDELIIQDIYGKRIM